MQEITQKTKHNVVSRSYYVLKCTNAQPLSIGGTEHFTTDKDVLIGSNGNPIIPATSIAGALRDLANKMFGEEIAGEIFGNRWDDRLQQSRLIIDDSEIESKGNLLSVRNYVRLEDRVAVDGALFNNQYVLSGQKFNITLELVHYQDDHDLQAYIKSLLSSIACRQLYLGGKKNRGFGLIEVLEAQSVTFDLTNQTDYLDWLEFDYSTFSLDNVALEEVEDVYETFSLRMHQVSPFTVKSILSTNFDGVASGPSRVGEMVVIPGSSIAGSFRAHLVDFLGVEDHLVKGLFGREKSQEVSAKQSELIFHDVYLPRNLRKRTRNRIDRFTGGTLPTGLFSDYVQMPDSKEIEFEIRLRNPDLSQDFMHYLKSYVDSINMGFTTFGSYQSVGMGRFQVLSINDERVMIDA